MRGKSKNNRGHPLKKHPIIPFFFVGNERSLQARAPGTTSTGLLSSPCQLERVTGKSFLTATVQEILQQKNPTNVQDRNPSQPVCGKTFNVNYLTDFPGTKIQTSATLVVRDIDVWIFGPQTVWRETRVQIQVSSQPKFRNTRSKISISAIFKKMAEIRKKVDEHFPAAERKNV